MAECEVGGPEEANDAANAATMKGKGEKDVSNRTQRK